MSTISTHLNWGSSYVVDDVYRRFVAPDKSERHYVLMARISTVVLVMLAAALALWLEHAYQAFQIMLQIGAGTGLIYLLRWYWWRVNAWSEIAGMAISFAVAVYIQLVHPALGFAPLAPTVALLTGVAITTVGWITVTLLTPPTPVETLRDFYAKIRPMGPGWQRAVGAPAAREPGQADITAAFLAWFLGCACVYSALFATGSVLYGRWVAGLAYGVGVVVTGTALLRLLPRIAADE